MTSVVVEDVGPALRCTVRLPGCTTERALEAFTSPEVLARWWYGELTVDLVPGGAYIVWFPVPKARMNGEVIRYLPGEALEFTWAWDHEPDARPRTVVVTASNAPDDVVLLTIEHAPHSDDEAGVAARADHRAGWEHFLPRLPDAMTG